MTVMWDLIGYSLTFSTQEYVYIAHAHTVNIVVVGVLLAASSTLRCWMYLTMIAILMRPTFLLPALLYS